MKIKAIEYRLTTTDKLICDKCKQLINGKEGYLKISFIRERRAYQILTTDFFIKICNNCSEKAIENYQAGRKTRIEDWRKLLKKRILVGLK